MLDISIREGLPLSLAPFDEIRLEGRQVSSDGPWGQTEIGAYHDELLHVARWMLPRGEKPEQHELILQGPEERLYLYVDGERVDTRDWDVLKLRAYPGSLQLLGEDDGEWRLVASCVGGQWRSAGGTPWMGVVRLVSSLALAEGLPVVVDSGPRGRLSALAERIPLVHGLG